MDVASEPANQLRDTTVFIIDESTMASRYVFEAINRLLQDIMGNKRPFGGKIMLLG